MKRTVHIVGAGGIGVALAWCLMREDCNVTVVEVHAHKIKAGRDHGLRVAGRETVFPSWVNFNDWTPPAAAFVLLCTKTYDNSVVLARLPSPSRLVPVQNGFDPVLEQQSHPGEGIASFVSECLWDRPVTRITRPGCLHLGARREVTARERAELAELATALASAELFPVQFVEDVRPYKAAKLMYNAAISPLAAAAGVDNGELLIDRLAKRLFFGLLRENYAILRQAGVALARIGPFHPATVWRILRTPVLPSLMAVFFRSSLRGTYCSMAPDMGTGRTEIEAYNGHLIRLAGRFPCPINRAVLALIEKMVRERLRPQRERLQCLVELLPKGVWH